MCLACSWTRDGVVSGGGKGNGELSEGSDLGPKRTAPGCVEIKHRGRGQEQGG